MLISLVVTMTVMAVVGSAMVYYTTTGSFGELLDNRKARAYYVAEGGANYALQRFVANKVTNGPFPSLTLFTLSNGDQFAVKTYDVPGDSSRLIIESTGIVSAGWLTSRIKVVKNIEKATATLPGQDAPASVGFDLDSDSSLDTSWNVAPGTVVSIVNTGPSGGPALQFKGDSSAISLNWQGSATAPNLLSLWNSQGQLLGYTIQVKININSEGGKGRHYLVGLSFRVDNDPDSETGNAYGLSYFRSYGTDKDNQKPAWIKSAAFASFAPISNGYLYAVFWKKIGGIYTVLDYHPLTTADGVVSAGELLPWSSLIVKVDEQFSGSGGSRQNHIYAYLASASTYPQGTITWQLTNFTEILWSQYAGIPSRAAAAAYALGSVVVPSPKNGHSYLCTQAGTSGNTAPTWPVNRNETVADNTVVWTESNKLLDSSLTSANFDTRLPDEIGVHAFYDSNASNDQFFADFGMVAKGSGSGSGGVQY